MSRRPEVRRIEVVEEAVAAVLRRKTPAERVAMILACNRTVRLWIASHLRTLHPDWDDQAVAREIARRMLSDDPVDRDYVAHWAKQLNVEVVWQTVLERFGEFSAG